MNFKMSKISSQFSNIVFTVMLFQLLLVSDVLSGQHTVLNKSIRSSYLNQEVNYIAMLPNGFANADKQYSVVYLLHGIGGSGANWIDRCRINALADSLLHEDLIGEYIYIMPDAGNSYYINNYDSSFLYMDFFMKELIPTIDSIFPTTKSTKHRALLGLSMGGFGAIILAAKHSNSFGVVMTMSAAIRTEALFTSIPQYKYDNYFGSVFGPGLRGEERITEHWKANSPYTLMNPLLAVELAELHWYIDCGSEDLLLPANESFHHLYTQYNIPHEYHTGPGKHNWEYWHRATVNALTFLHRLPAYSIIR